MIADIAGSRSTRTAPVSTPRRMHASMPERSSARRAATTLRAATSSSRSFGFRAGDTAYGRPVGVIIAKDGSLLVADDVGNKIWRVSAATLPTKVASR